MHATDLSNKDEFETATRAQVINTIDRVCEACFGLFMALTFVGAVSAATAGQDAGREMLYAALGCNLAWGLVDGVMFLVRTLTDRGRRLALALAVRNAPDAATGVRLVRDALPPTLRSLVEDPELELIRLRLAGAKDLPASARLGRGDLIGAAEIFAIVVLATFPVALPFVVFSKVSTALLVSRVLTLAMLFAGGYALGRHAGFGGWKAGAWMVALGVVLTMAIIALGG